MATLSVRGTRVSPPHIGVSEAESESLGEMPNDPCAAVMAMELRQPLQVIVSAHEVLARRLRGGAARAQLTLIEAAAMRLAGTVDRLVEILQLQEASTRADRARRTTRNAKDRMMENKF
jgi:nitrogen-specific signal transduction histidine kinase